MNENLDSEKTAKLRSDGGEGPGPLPPTRVVHPELASSHPMKHRAPCDWLEQVAVDTERFGFRLRAELGRGAFARVFLAEQVDLAGRYVVLKISTSEGKEPQTLAQMQHTHIVPIFSTHEDRSTGLR